jgi:hypothetical protein
VAVRGDRPVPGVWRRATGDCPRAYRVEDLGFAPPSVYTSMVASGPSTALPDPVMSNLRVIDTSAPVAHASSPTTCPFRGCGIRESKRPTGVISAENPRLSCSEVLSGRSDRLNIGQRSGQRNRRPCRCLSLRSTRRVRCRGDLGSPGRSRGGGQPALSGGLSIQPLGAVRHREPAQGPDEGVGSVGDQE